ncbi:MAG: anthranilate synthase component I family protein [Bacteroidota bacterium]
MLDLHTLLSLKQHAASWVATHPVGLVLDSNECQAAFGLKNYELLIAAGVKDEFRAGENAFQQLDTFRKQNKHEWLFGFLTYDLKNQLEALESSHPDGIGFPGLYFFVPQKLIVIDKNGECLIGKEWIDEILQHPEVSGEMPAVSLTQRVAKQQYIQDVEAIKQHIINGDVYELNYCVEFFATNVSVQPDQVYNKLRSKSAVPFGCFVKCYHQFVIGASPERFLLKQGNTVYSQPIKGTIKRGNAPEEDELFKHNLLHSEKERAENLMIVDLVRNDLAKSAQTGTVKVEELFGIYSFPQVHQMISTVSAMLRNDVTLPEVIQHAFPMGSMTGAPKIMAMKLIEQYEKTKRGLYAGAIGFITPEGNMDLNVVIRSIQYNAETRYLNFEVGGAITYDSIAELEYEECLLKAKAMFEVLGGR